jgi:hypothetical protein
MNGTEERPRIFGKATMIDGELVWQKFTVEIWANENSRSFASDKYKLFDGYYWQDYSYSISTDLDSLSWYDEYRKFVHPAGLKMFSAIAIEIAARNQWLEELDYDSKDVRTDTDWLHALIPPHVKNDTLFGFHTPKYQPGFLRERIFKYLYKYVFDRSSQDDFIRAVFFELSSISIEGVDVRNSYVRSRYQINEKFIDPCRIGDGWLNKIISDADAPFRNSNAYAISNISCYIISGDTDDVGGGDGIFNSAFYDVTLGDGDGDWLESAFNDISTPDASGNWDDSLFETL